MSNSFSNKPNDVPVSLNKDSKSLIIAHAPHPDKQNQAILSLLCMSFIGSKLFIPKPLIEMKYTVRQLCKTIAWF